MCDRSVTIHNDSNCVEAELICDGKKDCPDGQDENPTLCSTYNCQDDHFKCAKSNKCISITSVCDGTDDCSDGSDEKQCG